MVIVKLRSADFFSNPTTREHTFHFDLSHRNRSLGTINVVTAHIEGGLNAVHDRAHDNLITILEEALKHLHERRARPTDELPGIPAAEASQAQPEYARNLA